MKLTAHNANFPTALELGGYKPLKAIFDEREKVSHYVEAPATLLPTPFYRQLFCHAMYLAAPFNSLCNSMVTHTKWLLQSYERIQTIDDFVENFVKISQRVYVTGSKDVNTCLKGYVTRSDYLPYLDSKGVPCLGQVEINLSSVVGPDVMQDLVDFHRDMLVHYTENNEALPHRVPSNEPLRKFGQFLSLVPRVYERRFSIKGHRQIILFVMGNTESNWSEIYAQIREVRKHGHLVYAL
eukprot:Gregarina_sp_Poly_1__3941@NODE_2184_length_2535_cov_422_368314_g629_i1_p2_GENE_NODE_2184_length_2535_cov_422_368314_g629_i1NODE_2184_length_2535_cov_422_368314_g629_i1_p2_ORF_typecomplete_len239_score8_10GSH_synth_ATP/PF03917_17/6_6e26ACP_PD/PF04336_12/0_44ACP_PD/PF04336_12/2_8e03_NODE_2184_length_2535_cov_422_368314_g629_i19611677